MSSDLYTKLAEALGAPRNAVKSILLNSTCEQCNHWQPDRWITRTLNGESDRDVSKAIADCDVLLEVLELGDEMHRVSTPIDFGCNKWERLPPHPKGEA